MSNCYYEGLSIYNNGRYSRDRILCQFSHWLMKWRCRGMKSFAQTNVFIIIFLITVSYWVM